MVSVSYPGLSGERYVKGEAQVWREEPPGMGHEMDRRVMPRRKTGSRGVRVSTVCEVGAEAAEDCSCFSLLVPQSRLWHGGRAKNQAGK